MVLQPDRQVKLLNEGLRVAVPLRREASPLRGKGEHVRVDVRSQSVQRPADVPLILAPVLLQEDRLIEPEHPPDDGHPPVGGPGEGLDGAQGAELLAALPVEEGVQLVGVVDEEEGVLVAEGCLRLPAVKVQPEVGAVVQLKEEEEGAEDDVLQGVVHQAAQLGRPPGEEEVVEQLKEVEGEGEEEEEEKAGEEGGPLEETEEEHFRENLKNKQFLLLF